MLPEDIRKKYSTRHMSTVSILQFFADSHLHPTLKEIVIPIREVAFKMVDNFNDGPELTIGLRNLLDAKDAFLRHCLIVHNFSLPTIQRAVTLADV